MKTIRQHIHSLSNVVRRGTTKLLIGLLIVLPAALLQPVPAAAICNSSVVVANTNDTGAGSLRQALLDVCSGGTISFAAGLSGSTFNLATFLNIDHSMTIDASVLPVTSSSVS